MYHVERVVCPMKEGDVHFGRKAQHLKVKGEGRALGHLESSPPPSVEKQLVSSGAGKMHHSELGNLP